MLTLEFFGLFHILGGLGVAAEDLLGPDIFTVAGAAILRFEEAVPDFA